MGVLQKIKNSIIFIILITVFQNCGNNNERDKIVEKESKEKDYKDLVGSIIQIESDSSIKFLKISQHADYEWPFAYFVKFNADSNCFNNLIKNLNLISYAQSKKDSVFTKHHDYNTFYKDSFWIGKAINSNLKAMIKNEEDNGELIWWNPNTFDSTNLLASFYDVDSTMSLGRIESRPKSNYFPGRLLCSYQNGSVYLFIDTSRH